MNKREKKDKIETKLVQLINLFNELDVEKKELVEVLSAFLYSIGSSLLDNPPKTGEEVLMKYAESPTLGTALMAQAIFMKETWSQKEEKTNATKPRRKNLRRTQERKKEATLL